MWEPVCVEGVYLPPSPYNVPWDQLVTDIRGLTMRESDVIICAYPKAGTHWIWEVIQMLTNGAASYDKKAKEFQMIEFSTKSHLDAIPSPRILNSHLPFSMLPVADIKDKKVKVVHVYRNPKDSLISMWYHFKQMLSNEEWSLKSFLEKYTNGPIFFNTQTEYLRQMEEFMDKNPDVPIYNLSFEETKRRPVETVKRLAQFLEAAASDELCRDIADACSFKKMKEADKDKALPADTHLDVKLDVYRKGEVGDWKNYLSAEDNDAMDKFISEGLQGLTKFHMEYSLPESQE